MAAAACAVGIALGIFLLLLATALVAVGITGATLVMTNTRLLDLDRAPVLHVSHDGPWQTGDLILTRHAEVQWAPRKAPQHGGILWAHAELGPLVLDMSPEEANVGPEHTVRDVRTDAAPVTAVRLQRLADFVKQYNGAVFIRRITRGAVPTARFEDALHTWGLNMEFDRVTPAIMATLAVTHISRGVTANLMHWLWPLRDALTGKRARGMYCTEFVAELLQAVGVVDPAYDARLCTPPSMSSSIGDLDAAAAPYGLAWGPEHRLLALHTDTA